MIFVILLFAMIGLAWLLPGPGAQTGPLSLHAFANYGVTVIFFLYGLGSSLRQFRDGLADPRIHLLIHLATFLLFPLLALAAYGLFARDDNRLLCFGVFYLAALPSTVSSSVVMVGIARGNTHAAIFNASLSGILGVFITPLWIALFRSGGADFGGTGIASPGAETVAYNPGAAILSLCVLVVLPIVLGIALNRWGGDFVVRHRGRLRLFDQSVILALVYCSFCATFASGGLDGLGWRTVALLSVAMVALFFLVYGITSILCRLLRFSRADTIAATFCGSKKSLMHGTVMAAALLNGIDGVGLVLLPLMLYHALQLLIVGIIATRLRKAEDAEIAKADLTGTPVKSDG